MKRDGLIAILAAAMVLGACNASRERVEPRDDGLAGGCDNVAVTIEFAIGDNHVSYPNKKADPIPRLRRNRPFCVETKWLGSAKRLALSNFRAVRHVGHGKWEEVEHREISGEKGEPLGDNEVVFEPPATTWGPYWLRTEERGGPPPLILFTVKFTTAEGAEVTFDPPWSEKP